jgi:glycosyltransferase involved in cell wall biosynthesis
LKLLKNVFNNSDEDILNKAQFYMCGFDLRTRNPQTGQMGMDAPMYSEWVKFEKLFTNNYKNIKNPEYLAWLKEYVDNGEGMFGYNEKFKDEYYQRRWTKQIFTYGTMYNEADVALAPLNDSPFNNMKSQLKVLEAGIHKCPIIASNNGPYKLDVVDGKNGFLIDTFSVSQWYDKIKYFIDNPNAVVDMGEALYETVTEKYTLDIVNKKRADFLKSNK